MSFDEKIDVLVERIRNWVSEEPMTPLERLNRTYEFKEPDHVPVGFAMWAPSCIGVKDVTTKEYYTDPKKMYYTQLIGLDKYKHDVPAALADCYNVEPEACGSKLLYSENSMPVIADHFIKDPKDLKKLKVPDPYKDGRMPYILEICRLHKEKLGDIVGAYSAINAPFSMATGLRKYEDLAIDMKRDPDFVHELLNFCVEVIIEFGKAIIEVCGAAPMLADARACLPCISPQQVDEFAAPYAARCLQALNRPCWFYAWGFSLAPNWKTFLRKILAAGEGSLTLFEEDIRGIRGYKTVDLVEFKRICARQKVVLWTCVHPDTMFEGSVETIQNRVRDWIKAVSPGSGHAFYTSIPYDTPPEHVRAYVDAVKLYGKYPINL